MILIFVNCAQPLSVNYENIHLRALILNYNWGFPNPQSFGACIDCRANIESLLFI